MNCDRVITLPCSLYGFCDASTAAYAAVMYLVVETSKSQVIKFCCCKDKSCTPRSTDHPKARTVVSATTSSVDNHCVKEPFNKSRADGTKLFHGFKIAYFWIKSTGRDWRPFVQN